MFIYSPEKSIYIFYEEKKSFFFRFKKKANSNSTPIYKLKLQVRYYLGHTVKLVQMIGKYRIFNVLHRLQKKESIIRFKLKNFCPNSSSSEMTISMSVTNLEIVHEWLNRNEFKTGVQNLSTISIMHRKHSS